MPKLTEVKRRAFRALWDARLVWMCISVVVILIFVFSSSIEAKPDGLRYAGLLLEILGALTIGYGISSKGKLFGKAQLWEMTKNWFATLSTIFDTKKPHIGSGSLQAGNATLRGTGYVTKKAKEGAALEDRVGILEKSLQTAFNRIANNEQAHKKETADLTSTLNTQATEYQQQLSELKNKLEELATSDLHLETVGLVWIVIGLVLANIPDEIVSFWRLILHTSM